MTPHYNRIGRGYDATRRADPYITQRLAHHLHPQEGAKYVDVACGTGNYTCALAQLPGHWHGVDISTRMIGAAAKKTREVNWCLGNAARLPFGDGSFAGVICTLALHHFKALLPIFSEVHRVLSGGNLVIFTAGQDQMRRYWLNEYFPESMRKSILQMPDTDIVKQTLNEAGFAKLATETYDVRPDLQDLFLYGAKSRPSLYLDENFRRGISTFSSLASPGEVEQGCTRLAADIASGHISEVIARYYNPGGDYLFIIASKDA